MEAITKLNKNITKDITIIADGGTHFIPPGFNGIISALIIATFPAAATIKYIISDYVFPADVLYCEIYFIDSGGNKIIIERYPNTGAPIGKINHFNNFILKENETLGFDVRIINPFVGFTLTPNYYLVILDTLAMA